MDHVADTADALEAAADRLESAAGDVRRTAKRMRETGDRTYAGEAASTVAQVKQVKPALADVVRRLIVYSAGQWQGKRGCNGAAVNSERDR